MDRSPDQSEEGPNPLRCDDDDKFHFRSEISWEKVNSFREDGFTVVSPALDSATVQEMNQQLEKVLRGSYNRGHAPDKRPKVIKSELRDMGLSWRSNKEPQQQKLHQDFKSKKSQRRGRGVGGGVGPLGFSGNLQNVKVLQLINVHKCDQLFRKVATSPSLGRVVAELTGWENGVRLAQDQVWAKPPGAAPLVFHRDSPYFMFDPPDVVTVWIALDDMDDEIGPLEYVKGSHRWGEGRVGSAGQFFHCGHTSLLESAAEREGVAMENLQFQSMAGMSAGGISIHNGRTWHGSGKNRSRTRPRRGLGLHFVPEEVRFTEEARKSRLWGPYLDGVEDATSIELSEVDFPVVCRPTTSQISQT